VLPRITAQAAVLSGTAGQTAVLPETGAQTEQLQLLRQHVAIERLVVDDQAAARAPPLCSTRKSDCPFPADACFRCAQTVLLPEFAAEAAVVPETAAQTEQLQLLRQHVAIERLVVDDQDAGWGYRLCSTR
jgi:hypothetical protein